MDKFKKDQEASGVCVFLFNYRECAAGRAAGLAKLLEESAYGAPTA